MRMADLQPGWTVVANDNHQIGKIREVGQHYIEVSAGRFSEALYIPASAIANVDSRTVRLNLASAEIEVMGWQQPPRSSDALRTTPERDIDREI